MFPTQQQTVFRKISACSQLLLHWSGRIFLISILVKINFIDKCSIKQSANIKFLEIKATGLNFWTSGSNEGKECNLKNGYIWCSSDTFMAPELLNQIFWSNMIPKNPDVERCLGFSFNSSSNDKSGFLHQLCNMTINYICEVRDIMHHLSIN